MALREFDDRDGTRWQVWDTVPESTAGLVARFRSGWLTFDNGAERRRLAPVPERWAELPPERLGLLLRMAGAAGGRNDAAARLEEDRRVAERRAAERRVRDRRSRGPAASPGE